MLEFPQNSRKLMKTGSEMFRKIPFIKPSLPSPEDIAVDLKEIAENNWYTNFGPFERRFSRGIAEYIGQGCLASTMNNATSALMIAIQATLGQGDRTRSVIVPSFTFVAGPEAIVWNGYKPLFVDIDPETWQPDAQQAAELLKRERDNIAGILHCNTFGVGSPYIGSWERLSSEYEIPMIVDSAAGFGSEYLDGNKLGAAGTCEVFSFHATKPFAVGEAGAVTARDHALIKRLDAIQNFGFEGGRASMHLGMNAKLSEVMAAIGVRQLETFDGELMQRRYIAEQYVRALGSMVVFQDNTLNSSLCFLSAAFPNKEQKRSVLAALNEAGVQARDYYNPIITEHPYFAEMAGDLDLSNSVDIAERVVSLPLYTGLSTDDIQYIADVVHDTLDL